MVKRIKYYKHTGYKGLAYAICAFALRDYFEARSEGNLAMERDCIRFFKSPWFTELSGHDGRDVTEKLRKKRRRRK